MPIMFYKIALLSLQHREMWANKSSFTWRSTITLVLYLFFFTSFLPYKNRFEISFLVMTVPTRNEWWCRSSQHPGKLGDQNLGEIFMGRLDRKFLAMKKKDLKRYSSKNIGIPMGYIYIYSIYYIICYIYIYYTHIVWAIWETQGSRRGH